MHTEKYHNVMLCNLIIGEQIGKLKVDETHLYEFSVRNNMLVARDDKGRSHLYHLTYWCSGHKLYGWWIDRISLYQRHHCILFFFLFYSKLLLFLHSGRSVHDIFYLFLTITSDWKNNYRNKVYKLLTEIGELAILIELLLTDPDGQRAENSSGMWLHYNRLAYDWEDTLPTIQKGCFIL